MNTLTILVIIGSILTIIFLILVIRNMPRTMDKLNGLTPENCHWFEPAGRFQDDKGKSSCLAHLDSGRVLDCWIARDKKRTKECNDFETKQEAEAKYRPKPQ